MSDDRDPALDALLRTHSAAMSPRHLDAAILAAARRAVDSAPRDAARALARQSWRWWMPLAAAAAIGAIVIGVLPLAPVTPAETPSTVTDVPASSRASEKDAVDAAAERRGKADTEANVGVAAQPPVARQEAASKVQRQASAPAARAPTTVVPKAVTAPPTAPKATTAAPVTRERAGAPPPNRAPMSPPAQPQAAAPAPSREAGALASSPLDAARPPALAKREADERADSSARDAAPWIARIRALRREGNVDAARHELIRFRKAFPDADARLPDDLREWTSSVR